MSGTSSTPAGFGANRHLWLFMLILGIIEIVLGIIGLGYAVLLTVVTVFLFGILMMIGGIVHVARAFTAQRWGGTALHLLFAVCYEIAGLYFFLNPAAAAVDLTLILAIFFVVTGVFRIVGSVAAQHYGWGASLLVGVINLLLGALLWMQWPLSGILFIGLCVAFDLMFAGVSWVMFALTTREIQATR